ncbi:E3 ubiquitin-protein ligase ATL31-like [Macadamia integrifolia]|uniref:E3 ubiquitin-protein ligase ATL31-like n=1 Tax=Macadamia integrifolia TaxID=60698 RepID=UPI001C52A287|nr:E3 ubiquitin-protein ligase ATL31-like [Macadamia integrifolia]
MKNQLKKKQKQKQKQKQNQNQSQHRSILNLFGRNGFICIYLFMFLSLPYAAAQNSTQSPPMDPYGFSNSFSPSTAILIVIIMTAFFILAFFSIYVGQCCGPQTVGSIHLNRVGGGISRRRNQGLDLAVIDTFPTFAYSYVKDHKLGKGALECAVCLSEFEDEDTLRLLPSCDHVFHPDCIDAWLSKHTTCPVCRANLGPVFGEIPGTAVPVQDIGGDSNGEIPASETGDAENQQVSSNMVSEEPQVVAVAVAVAPEVINQAPMQNRPARSMKPRNMGRFPRSHSTGHSLVQPGEDVERFTLRLPEGVRKQIMNMRQLSRTRSMVAFPRVGSSRMGYRTTGEGSSRGWKSFWGKGYRTNGEGSSRGGSSRGRKSMWGMSYRTTGEGSSREGNSVRGAMGEKPEGWVFSMTRPFLMRGSSPPPPQMTAEGDSPASPPPPKPLRSPSRVCTKADGTVPSLTRPPV